MMQKTLGDDLFHRVTRACGDMYLETSLLGSDSDR